MLNVPKRANDAMHMSMLDGYDVSLLLLYHFVDYFFHSLHVVVKFDSSVMYNFLLGASILSGVQ